MIYFYEAEHKDVPRAKQMLSKYVELGKDQGRLDNAKAVLIVIEKTNPGCEAGTQEEVAPFIEESFGDIILNSQPVIASLSGCKGIKFCVPETPSESPFETLPKPTELLPRSLRTLCL